MLRRNINFLLKRANIRQNLSHLRKPILPAVMSKKSTSEEEGFHGNNSTKFIRYLLTGAAVSSLSISEAANDAPTQEYPTFTEFKAKKKKLNDDANTYMEPVKTKLSVVMSEYSALETKLSSSALELYPVRSGRSGQITTSIPIEPFSEKDFFSFGSNTLEAQIKYALEGASTARDKKITLVLGKIRIGKSATVCALIGDTMERDELGRPILKKSRTGKSPVIDHSLKAMITRPEVYTSENGIDYTDTPGIDDNNGGEQAIANAVGMLSLLAQAKEIQGCLIVISYADFQPQNSDTILDTIEKITKVFKDVNTSFPRCLFLISDIPENLLAIEKKDKILQEMDKRIIDAKDILKTKQIHGLQALLSKVFESKKSDPQQESAKLYMLDHLSKEIRNGNVILLDLFSQSILNEIHTRVGRLDSPIHKENFRFLKFEPQLEMLLKVFKKDIESVQELIKDYYKHIEICKSGSARLPKLKQDITSLKKLIIEEKAHIEKELGDLKKKLAEEKRLAEGYESQRRSIADAIVEINTSTKEREYYIEKPICPDGLRRTFYEQRDWAGVIARYFSTFQIMPPDKGYPFIRTEIKLGGNVLPPGGFANTNGMVDFRPSDYGVTGRYTSNPGYSGDLDIVYYCAKKNHPSSLVELEDLIEEIKVLHDVIIKQLEPDLKKTMSIIDLFINRIAQYKKMLELLEIQESSLEDLSETIQVSAKETARLYEKIQIIKQSSGYQFVCKFFDAMSVEKVTDQEIGRISANMKQLQASLTSICSLSEKESPDSRNCLSTLPASFWKAILPIPDTKTDSIESTVGSTQPTM